MIRGKRSNPATKTSRKFPNPEANYSVCHHHDLSTSCHRISWCGLGKSLGREDWQEVDKVQSGDTALEVHKAELPTKLYARRLKQKSPRKGKGSTAIEGWNEYIKFTSDSVFQPPLKRSEVAGIFFYHFRNLLRNRITSGLGFKWGPSKEYQGTREGKGKGNVGGNDNLKIKLLANVNAGQQIFIFIRKAWLMLKRHNIIFIKSVPFKNRTISTFKHAWPGPLLQVSEQIFCVLARFCISQIQRIFLLILVMARVGTSSVDIVFKNRLSVSFCNSDQF